MIVYDETQSWWLEEALAAEGSTGAPAGPIADGDFDVAVVGGGYTGLWTALALRERDPHLRVVLVEAGICGMGASGKNGGFCHGYWSSLGPLTKSLGDDGALAAARAGSQAQQAIAGFLAERNEDVWWRPEGLIKVSTCPAQDRKLDQQAAAAKRLGAADQIVELSASDLQRYAVSPVFRRGLLFREVATLQPARLARALRRAVVDAGVALTEMTPVTNIEPGRPNALRTPFGRIRADEVVLASNAALTRDRFLRAYLTNFRSHAIITEPMPEVLARVNWTGGWGFSDGRMFLHWFRPTPDGRVVLGSSSGPVLADRGAESDRNGHSQRFIEHLRSALRRFLPALADAKVTHAWAGLVDIASDHAPFFGTLPEARVHYGCGYSGHGVNPTWIGGQILASLALNRQDEWTSLPFCHRTLRRFPPEPLRYLGGMAIRNAIVSCEEAEEEERTPTALARSVAALPALLGLHIGSRSID